MIAFFVEFENATNMTVGNNKVYVPSGSIDDVTEAACKISFRKWKNKDNDIGTLIESTLSAVDIISLAKTT